MLTKFTCPDGEHYPLLECLAKCRLTQRCLSLPTLRKCAEPHPLFSITGLLNGTMQEYLKATVEYSIKPHSRAFALLGQSHHSLLESYAIDEIAEKRFGNIMSGQPDLVDTENGVTTLWDYKTWGSYRVSRFLGMTAESYDSGEIYAKSGSWGKAGSPKMAKMWTPNPLVADTKEPTLQMNGYRMLLESSSVGHIDAMRLQVTVRDGGLVASTSRGIDKTIYVFDIERLDDDEVELYFNSKRKALQIALNGGKANMCTTEERWDDMRCRSYCEVSFACEYGKDVR